MIHGTPPLLPVPPATPDRAHSRARFPPGARPGVRALAAWTRRGTAPARWPSRPAGRPWSAEGIASAPATSASLGPTRRGPWTPAYGRGGVLTTINGNEAVQVIVIQLPTIRTTPLVRWAGHSCNAWDVPVHVDDLANMVISVARLRVPSLLPRAWPAIPCSRYPCRRGRVRVWRTFSGGGLAGACRPRGNGRNSTLVALAQSGDLPASPISSAAHVPAAAGAGPGGP
jgi:hypothetical protein